MPQIILHHYNGSPFSHKVRTMFGYTHMQWCSSITKEVPPRPALATLAGGYRKIPVAQIGADIFCDTRTITTEVAAITDKPELAIENCDSTVSEFVKAADLEIFLACLSSGTSFTLIRKALKDLSLGDIPRLLKDRAAMERASSVRMPSARQAKVMVQSHLENMENMLSDTYLFGARPTIADFSAYHGLWFIRDLAEKNLIKPFPKVNAWMDRISAFGEGRRTEISADQAIDIARNTEPRAVPDADCRHELIGKPVSIAPTDYGQDLTTGILAGSTNSQWILTREDAAVGTVNVHFPKQGFALTDRS